MSIIIVRECHKKKRNQTMLMIAIGWESIVVRVVSVAKKVIGLFKAEPTMQKSTLEFHLNTVRTLGLTPLIFAEEKVEFEKLNQIQTTVSNDVITVVYWRRKQESEMQWKPQTYSKGIELVIQQKLGKLTEVDRYHLYPI